MISPRMQALLTKIDAAEAEHYAGIRESAQHQKAAASAKKLAVRRRPPWAGLLTKPRGKRAAKKRRPA